MREIRDAASAGGVGKSVSRCGAALRGWGSAPSAVVASGARRGRGAGPAVPGAVLLVEGQQQRILTS